ncbi:iron export ABC transporter permease subunit FetB [Magnetospira sp. QH-2]|uniref:ABC transporter permease n=1 Tax=Magnetospira sp. (strain QH-2) TaxID=1288970 RepID=UPI0003E812EF|nr:iron export ABC transporter permease subunit FetB [Magnetospira sp. QH-2]CCQ72485.1 conserved membrane protein of unknown function, putative permease of an ABC transporter [Magnetospira sp. QH-2]
MTYVRLDYLDIAISALLLLIHGGLSLRLRLGLGRTMIIATVRMVVQLTLIGLVLQQLFEMVSPWATGLAALVMITFAGREIAARQHHKLEGWWAHGLGSGSMVMAGTLVTLLALTTQIRPDPWYDPRYALPLFGMIMGNAMTGVSLGLDRLLAAAVRERVAIEARLALGHTRWQATETMVRDAMRAGLMPIVNAMAASGVVSLPGMMTGQILAGVAPTEAVKYQLLIMFLIAGAVGLGVMGAVMGGVWRLTDERHRLRLDRLQGTGRHG